MEINNEPLIARQVRVLSTCFPGAEIIAVIGFESERVQSAIPDFVNTVYNDSYETSNIGLSLKLATNISENNRCLYVYGDLVFDSGWFPPLDHSWTIYNKKNQYNKNDVGVVINADHVTNFSYGLPEKWGQITFLEDIELDMFKFAYNKPKSERLFGFELLNSIISNGGKIKGIKSEDTNIIEIDSMKDLKRARKHCE